MTRARKLKKTIRARARKTGESYTAARRQVLEARRRRSAVPAASPAVEPAAPPAAAPTPAAATRARRSTRSDSIKEKTGHDLAYWFTVLDAFDAGRRGHTAAARHISNDHGVPGWYAQTITVEYERARGLRAVNQSSAGDFQVSVSKTLAAPMAAVTAALTDGRRRRRWLRGVDAGLEAALAAAFDGPAGRPLRFKKPGQAGIRLPWDGGKLQLSIEARADGRCALVASNTKLPDSAEVERRRQVWRAALEALRVHLQG